MPEKVFIETFGCQMNVYDSELVANLLLKDNFIIADNPRESDVIIINTCSIRENAEQRVIKRLREYQSLLKKKPDLRIGLIGCMARRLAENFQDDNITVHFFAGPDSYRNIVDIIRNSYKEKIIDVELNPSENYEEFTPIQVLNRSISAFVVIMRGCENFCSYCVVPYTRGKERSRPVSDIIKEIKNHYENGIKEITLLGQNVNSYKFIETDELVNFPKLLKKIAEQFPAIRIRFATSHPKDLSDELIYTISQYPNLCKSIHLPLQSGSNAVLARMNRKYTAEWYYERVQKIYEVMPDCTISTDIIAGFCGETEEDHQATLEMMKKCNFFYSFMFKYSERSGTIAANKYKDDVPDSIKTRRLNEIIDLQQQISLQHNKKDIGKTFEVLVEANSKKSSAKLMGRSTYNKVIVFEVPENLKVNMGDVVKVKIEKVTSATLIGEIV